VPKEQGKLQTAEQRKRALWSEIEMNRRERWQKNQQTDPTMNEKKAVNSQIKQTRRETNKQSNRHRGQQKKTCQGPGPNLVRSHS
jgi:hypothetical protein